MKYLLNIFFVCLTSIVFSQQSNYIFWSFEVGDRIYSNPLVDDDIVYFGSNDNYLYAVDINSGNELWSYQTAFNVQSGSAIQDSIVYFESGNNCYALNKLTGDEVWVFESNDPDGAELIDTWDYHHSTPFIDDTIVYFCCGNGRVYGFDYLNGDLITEFTTLDSSAIRSVPTVNNGILYFGDYNGIIYAFDINVQDTIWTYKTYNNQPYPTFGQLNSEFIVYDSLLVFGSRNHRLQVINAFTGDFIWDYTSPDGGWISGDPLVYNDTLYIGGSDNHKMFAFNVYTGELYWTYEFLYNNFSKPMICGNNLVFSTGNAYANSGTNYGQGYLYAIDRNNGLIKNFSLIGGNLFTSPVFNDGYLLICSDDKHLYAIDSLAFLSDNISLQELGYHSVEILQLFPNPFDDSINIKYEIKFKTEISITIYNFDGKRINTLTKSNKDKGKHIVKWNGKDYSNNEVPDGYYFVVIRSNQFIINGLILKKSNK